MGARHTPGSFWAYVDQQSDCWLWTGYVSTDGYGQLVYQRRKYKAHRLAYELTFGSIDPGMMVCHRCDTPLCCRPDHLFLGTNADNMADCVRKGRSARRSSHSQARLTEDAVVEIRERYAAGLDSQQSLADRFGVHRTTIGHVVRGGTWS